jgi:uncharacterized membrane protein YoaK (UPF0700 family)
LFGKDISKRECSFVITAGALIAFNSGFVNGSCVSGLLSPTGASQSVAGFTSSYTKSALAIVDGDWSTYGFNIGLIWSYMAGAFISGIITPDATPYQIQPTYGPTFLIGGVFLMTASILAALEAHPTYIFFLAAAANGIQNGIASIYSANLIRCSLTGSTTDIALVAAQLLQGNRKQLWKGMVILSIVCSFWLGGLISFFATRRFLSYTLFFNAALFWLIGIALVYFLVNELHVSMEAAIFGSWKWKNAIRRLNESSNGGDGETESRLLDMFDEIDADMNGQIEPDELLDFLLKANIKMSAKGVRILIKCADEDGDGLINREEWNKICEKVHCCL